MTPVEELIADIQTLANTVDAGLTRLLEPDEEAAKVAAGILLLGTYEAIWNEHHKKVSHLIPVNTFDADEEPATVCGAVARNADLYPEYDICPECTK